MLSLPVISVFASVSSTGMVLGFGAAAVVSGKVTGASSEICSSGAGSDDFPGEGVKVNSEFKSVFC